jgi:RNA polymerase sigma factor (sigma-70 family)
VEENIGLVYLVAKRRRSVGRLPFEDRIGAGTLGLIRAAQKFDPGRGVTLSTYAVPWIRTFIDRAIVRDARARGLGTLEDFEHEPADHRGEVVDLERLATAGAVMRAVQKLPRREMMAAFEHFWHGNGRRPSDLAMDALKVFLEAEGVTSFRPARA